MAAIGAGKLLIAQFLWMPLHPHQKLVQAFDVNDLRIVIVTLKGDNEDHNVHAGVSRISDGPQEREEQGGQVRYALLFRPCGQLGVRNGSKGGHKVDLVQRDLICPWILRVLYTAVGERATLNS